MKLTELEKRLQQRLEIALRGLPVELGNEAVNWTKDNFRRQGWPGKGFQAWRPRKANARRNKGRAILVDSGRLSRSPRIVRLGKLKVEIGAFVPYARVHNYGFVGTVNVRPHKRTVKGKKGARTIANIRGFQRNMRMPARRFIGSSPILQSILRKKAAIVIGRQLKSS